MRLCPDWLVVVCRAHLALVVGVVGHAHVHDLEAELAGVVGAEDAVAGDAGDGAVVAWRR